MNKIDLENLLDFYSNIYNSEMLNFQKLPDGSLITSKSKYSVSYYEKSKATKNKKVYIRKENIDKARKLAQKSYLKKVLTLSYKRINQVKKILLDYDTDEIDLIYEKLSIERKALIKPVKTTKKLYINEWKQQKIPSSNFFKDDLKIIANSGILVRSKSEKILADLFDEFDLIYKYEKPIKIDKYTLRPDFTILNTETCEEIIWEHFGLIDNYNYANKAIKKIILYESNGYIRGNNLIISYETTENPLNTNWIRNIIKYHFNK